MATFILKLRSHIGADGLWRVTYVKEEFRSNNLESVRRLGTRGYQQKSGWQWF
ncbi:hypothetical protein [Nostoc sp. MG11]|uniref:hypothetical protein n=1 Tax=Nostoc sp. MG11 TaxID=2721166 RepID=UPI0018664668|nr:hypothetical protein [Nostoc sp. MG11]